MGRLSIVSISLAASVVGSLAGCLPGLGDYEIVPEQPSTDGGAYDAGTRPMGTPDLGTECSPTHLAVLVGEQSSGAGEIRRYSLPSLDPCRETALARARGELFGTLLSITAMPDASLRVGIGDTILAIGRDGRAMWRTEVEAMLGFVPLELFPLVIDGRPYLGVPYWSERGSSVEGFALLDAQGDVVLATEDVDFSITSVTADPRRPGSILVGEQFGEIRSYDVTLATTALRGGTVELDPAGSARLVTMASGTTASDITIAYQDGVARWSVGAIEPTRSSCVHCDADGYRIAVGDPTDPTRTLALCDAGSDLHLVSIDGASCAIVEDGTFLGSQETKSLTIVRAVP